MYNNSSFHGNQVMGGSKHFSKYIDMKYNLFHTEKVIEYFFSSFAQILWVFRYLLKSVARECVTMVTNHIATSKRIFSPNTRK